MVATHRQTKAEKTEYISLESAKYPDSWVCICGNRPIEDGFYACDSEGREVDPTPEEWTTDCYVCDRCGRIIRQDDLQVVGVRNART